MSRGTVHDLGYKRYVGTRRAQGTRWRVIARHQMRAAWKGFWRYKLPLLLALLNTTVWAIMMTQDTIKFGVSKLFPGGAPEDILLSMSYTGLGWYDRIAFIAGLTIAAGSVAGDAQAGAFQFYFARPIRPVDYVLGKLVGFWLLFAAILVGGPLVLTFVRLGMYGDGGDVLANLPLVAKVIGVGGLAALAYAAVTLAISAIVPNRRYAYAVWAAYFLVFGSIIGQIGVRTNPTLAAFDLSSALDSAVMHMLHLKPRMAQELIPAAYAYAGLALYAIGGTAILYTVVARQRSTGIGGS
jgi:ABC-2 type transport system permease protein